METVGIRYKARGEFMSEIKPISGKYFSDEVNVMDTLYTPCFKWATKYVRDAGYFSSHVYQAMSNEILDFILRDKSNHITLITCIDIFPSDFDAIVSDYSNGEDQVIEELKDMLNKPKISDPVKMLAAIVAAGQMTVYVSLRKRDTQNPYSNDHSKSGYFSNETKKVAFDGSINETYPAVVRGLSDGNKEHFNLFANWEIDQTSWDMFAEPIIRRVNEDSTGPFPKKGGEGTIIVEIKSIEKDQLPTMSDKDWDPVNHKKRAADRSNELYQDFEKRITSQTASHAAIENIPIILRKHQEKGLEKWKENDFRGILRHATGSGKTITALSAIGQHSCQGYPVLILVPSRLLLEQWIEEVSLFFPNANILPVGSGHSDWKKYLGIWTEEEKFEERIRITIAINDSARTDGFLQRVSKLKNSLLVVDECHRIGGQSFEKICNWKPEKVLGLSATPERYDDGLVRMTNLCGEVIHEYNLEDAIKDGHLTRYLYCIEEVSLTNEESENYNKLKDEISDSMRKLRGKDGNIDFSKIPIWLKIKLIEAKRIIKKAAQKTEVCGQIIEDNYDPHANQNWLVYCEDGEQLRAVRSELERRGISPLHDYWTGSEGAVLGSQENPKQLKFDRTGTIELWKREGGILLSIQCLDEGVNIPSISHGIILASSNNPRQFIQRRGRMLRKSEGKIFAKIWDAVVVPSLVDDEEGYNNYILGEIKRADIFAKNAFGGDAVVKLIELKHKFGIVDGVNSFDEED